VRLCIHGLHHRQRYEPTKIAMHAKIITTKPSAAPLMCVSKCHPTPHRYAIRFQPVATTGTTGPRSNALIKKWGHFGSLLWFSVLGNKTGTCTLAQSRRQRIAAVDKLACVGPVDAIAHTSLTSVSEKRRRIANIAVRPPLS